MLEALQELAPLLTLVDWVEGMSQIRLWKTESETRWVSLSSFDVTPVPFVPTSRGRTVIFDIVECIIMEWTMPNESRICRTVFILNKRRRVLLTSLQSRGKYRSGRY